MKNAIKKILKQKRAALVGTFIFASVTAFLMPFSINMLSKLLDYSTDATTKQVLLALVVYFAVYLGANLSTEVLDYVKRKLIKGIQMRLKYAVVEKIWNGRFMSVFTVKRGDILSYIKMCDEVVNDSLFPMFSAVSAIATFVASSVYILLIDYKILCVAYIIGGLWYGLTVIILKKAGMAESTLVESRKRTNAFISQMIVGKDDIAVWNREKVTISSMSQHHVRQQRAELHIAGIRYWRRQIDILIVAVASVCALALLGLQGYNTVQCITLFMYLSLILGAIAEANSLRQDWVGIGVKLKEISNIINMPDEEKVENATEKLGDIAIVDASVILDDKEILHNINAIFSAKSITVLWGKSGSGKSTIINLLLGFVPYSGDISIDGHILSPEKCCKIRQNTALLSQDVILLQGSIQDNILMGAEYNEAKLLYALQSSGLVRYGYTSDVVRNVIVDEGGGSLSVGQRQRVCVARAIYSDKEVMIFDEPTYALDDENAKIIVEALSSLRGQKTIIIATHDTRFLEICDNTIKLGD